MPLLAEYAVTPDVFDTACHSSEEVCGLHLQSIREVLLTEGLVRDLRGGEWSRLLAADGRSWHRRGKELLKKLAQQNRLVRQAPVLPSTPRDDAGWCREAVAVHGDSPFTGGIICTEQIKESLRDDAIVARVDRLSSSSWWAARSPSVRLARNVAEYQAHLDPVLRCANSLMFIDPHLDPGRAGYRDFAHLVESAGRRTPAPLIEIHRVCWQDARDKRANPEFVRQLETSFLNNLRHAMQRTGLRAEVFIWDDFHDRYLVSNLIGISVPYGFDTTADPKGITTWSRLGRPQAEDIQREFDPATGRHELHHRFVVG